MSYGLRELYYISLNYKIIRAKYEKKIFMLHYLKLNKMKVRNISI